MEDAPEEDMRPKNFMNNVSERSRKL